MPAPTTHTIGSRRNTFGWLPVRRTGTIYVAPVRGGNCLDEKSIPVSLLKKRPVQPLEGPTPYKIGCPFCWEWLPPARKRRDVFSADGCEGGQCQCGAFFVLDVTGRSGGQALMDAQVMACDGDLDRALKLDSNRDFEVKTRNLREAMGKHGRRVVVRGYLEPKVWALKLKRPE